MKNLQTFDEFLNEKKEAKIEGAGPKVNKFTSIWKKNEFGDITDINLFSDVEKKLGELSPEWQEALKNIKLKADKAICVFYASGQTDGDEVIYSAEEAGLDYEEVIPSQTTSARQLFGGPGILFSLKQ